MNTLPDMSYLSADRWKLWEIHEDTLRPYIADRDLAVPVEDPVDDLLINQEIDDLGAL